MRHTSAHKAAMRRAPGDAAELGTPALWSGPRRAVLAIAEWDGGITYTPRPGIEWKLA